MLPAVKTVRLLLREAFFTTNLISVTFGSTDAQENILGDICARIILTQQDYMKSAEATQVN